MAASALSRAFLVGAWTCGTLVYGTAVRAGRHPGRCVRRAADSGIVEWRGRQKTTSPLLSQGVTDDATSGSGAEPRPGEAPAEQSAAGGQRASEGRHWPGGRRESHLQLLTRSGFIEYDRVLFFSDAVFAIAITLLAVELRVPKSGLHDAVPGLISFGISFAVIGLYWLGHHAIFRYITALDRPLIALNLIFLGAIALLPYPTEVLTKAASTAAVVFYAVCGAAAGLGEAAIWLYATRPRSGLADPSAAGVRLHYSLRVARVPVVFLASIPVAFATPENAPYTWILILPLGIVINRLVPPPKAPEQIGEEIRG